MTTRILPVAEWGKVDAIVRAHGGTLPVAGQGQIAVTEDGDRIVGFLVVQLVVHAEPLWIDPAYRGRVRWRRLARLLERVLPIGVREYFVFAPDAHVGAMAEIGGCAPLPWTVYRRQLPAGGM